MHDQRHACMWMIFTLDGHARMHDGQLHGCVDTSSPVDYRGRAALPVQKQQRLLRFCVAPLLRVQHTKLLCETMPGLPWPKPKRRRLAITALV